MTKLETKHMLQAQVGDCVSTKKQNEDLVMHHKMKWDSCWDSFEIWLRNSIERP